MAGLFPVASRGEDGKIVASAIPAEKPYAIPALPMNEAIAKFAQASDVDIIYERTLVEGKVSKPLFGVYTPQIAVAKLLAGSDLASRFLRPKSAVIFFEGRPNTDAAGELGPKGPSLDLDPVHVHATLIIGSDLAESFLEYGKSAQAQIYNFLKSDTALRKANFQIRIAVQLDNKGRIEKLRFLQGTGDNVLDARIGEVLNNAQLSAPPPSRLPQPMKFSILSK